MIIFFGPAGSGKSVQGQILAARQGWRWLSAGQLLRETGDMDLMRQMKEGVLIDDNIVNNIMGSALKRATNVSQVILDGWPRALAQAKWLVASQPDHGKAIDLVIVLEVPKNELMKRLEVRGRADDNIDAIEERLSVYRQEVYPILSYLTEQNINIVHVDGTGTVGQIHDRIVEELQACKLV
ncbi:MAG TPA: nucleoside monophosphate kinase, partial [Candidatus Saccharibacteria bacterium]|nr:nucleoside monophosphate kinase [Candidatus Saccharibacteria bacterium]